MKILPSQHKIIKFITAAVFLFILSPSSLLLSQDRFRRSPPAPDPLASLSLPQIETQMLANGLSLSLVQIKDMPITRISLIIHAGEYLSPDAYPGLATFTSSLITTGTQTLSTGVLEEIIETIGGEFTTETSLGYSMYNFSFLEDYLDTALETLSQLIVEPGFFPRDIENIKRSIFYDIFGQRNSPDFLAKRLLYQILFDDHAAEKLVYSEDIIKEFSRESIIEYYNRYYVPNNAQFLLVGDLDLSTASRKVTRFFSRWQKKEIPLSNFDPPVPSQKIKICFVDMPQVKNATIFLGNTIAPFQAEDINPFSVFNRVLGETTNSRIFMNLRESKGYAYFAFSQLEMFENFGVFYIRAKVRSDVVTESIKEILREIQAIQQKAIPVLQIEQAKSSLIGSFPLKILELSGFSRKVADILIHDLGNDQWSKYYENIMQVSSRSVYDLIKNYFLLTPVVVVIGNRELILDALNAEFEEVAIYDQKGDIIEPSIR